MRVIFPPCHDESLTKPQGEVDDLRANHFEGESPDEVSGYTRGNRNDPMRAERDLDAAFEERGIADASEDDAFGQQ